MFLTKIKKALSYTKKALTYTKEVLINRHGTVASTLGALSTFLMGAAIGIGIFGFTAIPGLQFLAIPLIAMGAKGMHSAHKKGKEFDKEFQARLEQERSYIPEEAETTSETAPSIEPQAAPPPTESLNETPSPKNDLTIFGTPTAMRDFCKKAPSTEQQAASPPAESLTETTNYKKDLSIFGTPTAMRAFSEAGSAVVQKTLPRATGPEWLKKF